MTVFEEEEENADANDEGVRLTGVMLNRVSTERIASATWIVVSAASLHATPPQVDPRLPSTAEDLPEKPPASLRGWDEAFFEATAFSMSMLCHIWRARCGPASDASLRFILHRGESGR